VLGPVVVMGPCTGCPWGPVVKLLDEATNPPVLAPFGP
jgi:hypothetical protein